MFIISDVKLVADFPAVTPRDTPTIAIITSLFCEKMAVDAMLESKITYVRHVPDALTPGEPLLTLSSITVQSL